MDGDSSCDGGGGGDSGTVSYSRRFLRGCSVQAMASTERERESCVPLA